MIVHTTKQALRSWGSGGFAINCLGLGLLVLGLACGNTSRGDGVGNPPIVPIAPIAVLPLELSEVLLTGATPFAELKNAPQACVDDSDCLLGTCVDAWCSDPSIDPMALGLELCSPEQCEMWTEPLDFAADPLQRASLTIDPAAFGLSVNFGELAVRDADGLVHAYLAWGMDPGVRASQLFADAFFSGAADAGVFVPVGFPMPTGVSLASEDGNLGCAAPSRDAAPTDLSNALCPPAAGPFLTLSEVLPEQEVDGSSWIELLSLSTLELDLEGFRICQPPHCDLIGRGVLLPAGERILLHLGPVAAEPPIGEFGVAKGRTLARTGEVAIVAPGSAILSETDLFAYLHYGDGAASLAENAIEDGVWLGLEAARTVRLDGESLSASPEDALGASAWFPGEATPNAANLDLAGNPLLWASCSSPQIPGMVSGLRITSIDRGNQCPEVDPEDPDPSPCIPRSTTLVLSAVEAVDLVTVVVELELRGSLLLLQAPAAPKTPPAGDADGLSGDADGPGGDEDSIETLMLQAGESFTVELVGAGASCSGNEDQCWNEGVEVGEAGWAALRQDNSMVDFLLWGSGSVEQIQLGQEPATALEAFNTGLWPVKSDAAGNFVDLCALPLMMSELHLREGASGLSPADYVAVP